MTGIWLGSWQASKLTLFVFTHLTMLQTDGPVIAKTGNVAAYIGSFFAVMPGTKSKQKANKIGVVGCTRTVSEHNPHTSRGNGCCQL